MRRKIFGLGSTTAVLGAVVVLVGLGLSMAPPAYGQITGTITIWDANLPDGSPGFGNDPNMSVADPAGVTGHVASPGAALTIATVFENTGCSGQPCGITYWNPGINLFRCYGYSSGAMTGVDLNQSAPPVAGPDDMTIYGPGDT